jgi:hypothetical protein
MAQIPLQESGALRGTVLSHTHRKWIWTQFFITSNPSYTFWPEKLGHFLGNQVFLFFFSFFFLFLAVPRLELRASYLLGRHSTPWATSPALWDTNSKEQHTKSRFWLVMRTWWFCISQPYLNVQPVILPWVTQHLLQSELTHLTNIYGTATLCQVLGWPCSHGS